MANRFASPTSQKETMVIHWMAGRIWTFTSHLADEQKLTFCTQIVLLKWVYFYLQIQAWILITLDNNRDTHQHAKLVFLNWWLFCFVMISDCKLVICMMEAFPCGFLCDIWRGTKHRLYHSVLPTYRSLTLEWNFAWRGYSRSSVRLCIVLPHSV